MAPKTKYFGRSENPACGGVVGLGISNRGPPGEDVSFVYHPSEIQATKFARTMAPEQRGHQDRSLEQPAPILLPFFERGQPVVPLHSPQSITLRNRNWSLTTDH